MPIHRYPGGVVNADNVTPGANQASGVWTLESQLQANGTGFWPQSTSQMSRSLRFNVPDIAYLTRLPTVAGNRRIWTWSAWVKRSTLSTIQTIFAAGATGGSRDQIRFQSDNLAVYINNGSGGYYITTAVYRDVSAWYHIVLAVDTTQAVADDRKKLYVNGSQVTVFGTNVATSLNYECQTNSVVGHYLSYDPGEVSPFNTFGGYMTEVVFVDGQALAPTAFGYTDSNNVWQPKPYSGSVGTNGFYLTFADNTGVTPTTLGKDYSNRGNNWTPVNFSVASGADNDSLVDVPTNWGTDTGLGGEVRGNYCTFNPNLYNAGSVTYSNGNLLMTMTGNADRYNLGTIAVSTGKWYWELVGSGVSSSGNFIIGICKSSRVANGPWSAYGGPDTIYFNTSDGWSVYGSNIGGGTGTITNGDVIGVALDMDSNYIYLYKNNVLYASRSGSIDLTISHTLFVNTYNNGSSITLNAGQRPFTYTAPSGFKALCTQNLPTPTVQNGGQYFNAVLYTGNSSGASVTGVGFAPDFIWTKSRSNTTNHELIDIVRGGSSTLFSNLTNAQATQQRISAFGSDGWTYTTDSNSANTGYTFVGWNWKANGAGSSNTAGSRTSTVSVNSTSGFSIVTWNSGSAGNITVGHGLGVAPSMLIMKVRDAAGGWYVWFTGFTASQFLGLNDTGAVSTDSRLWANATPTSTVFSLESGYYPAANKDMVAYCFAPVAGYSAFGSYTGNGSSDGPFVYVGFRPRYILFKNSSAASGWNIFDTARDTYNAADKYLGAQTSAAESSGTAVVDILSNGFKLRNSWTDVNGNGNTIVYAAFAENPFKIARAR